MRQLARALAGLSVACVALLASGCNEGPAEAALEVAGRALEAAKPELARYSPDELASIDAAIGDARSQFEKGHYTEALKVAQDLPARIEAAVVAATARKEELTRAWTAAAEALGPVIEGLNARMTELAAAKLLPKGLDATRLASAHADLVALTTAWKQAGEAFDGGDVAGAIRAAQDVKVEAAALSDLLGLAVGPAAAPAGARAAR